MTYLQLKAAKEASAHLIELKDQKSYWEDCVKSTVGDPLLFRLNGLAIRHISKETLKNFKESCVADLKRQIEETDKLFESI